LGGPVFFWGGFLHCGEKCCGNFFLEKFRFLVEIFSLKNEKKIAKLSK
jgi:hypothetical protein